MDIRRKCGIHSLVKRTSRLSSLPQTEGKSFVKKFAVRQNSIDESAILWSARVAIEQAAFHVTTEIKKRHILLQGVRPTPGNFEPPFSTRAIPGAVFAEAARRTKACPARAAE